MPKKAKKKRKESGTIRCIGCGHFLGKAWIAIGRADFYCRYCSTKNSPQFTTIQNWPEEEKPKKKKGT